ncbi:MAG: helix-turn-helix transcriptional regulator [Leucothrix sp.]
MQSNYTIMRRADRLFQIIQILRTRQWVTAAKIAEDLQVSVRTVYRDVQDLSLSGTPIQSETGRGYKLDKSYNLPPMTFTEAELESLILGARMVQAWSDEQLASNATSALQRIESIVPKQLKDAFESTSLNVPTYHDLSAVAATLPELRDAIKSKSKIHIDYQREDTTPSTRILWPLGLFFWGSVWTLVAWCELRNNHRQFRVDRIQTLEKLSETFSETTGQLLETYLISATHEPPRNKQ